MVKHGGSELEPLLEAARDGDARAREVVFALSYEFVVERVKCRIVSEEDVEDVTQEVLLTLIQKFDDVPVGQFAGWLRKTIWNKLGDYIRRRTREGHVLVPFAEDVASLSHRSGWRPDQDYELKELGAIMQQIQSRLGADEQQLLSLLLAGIAQRELRQGAGTCCPGTGYSRVHRLRRKLVREFAEAGYITFEEHS